MWALDLGTTNSLLARWDSTASRPEVLPLSALARREVRVSADGVDTARGVPSAVHVIDEPSFWARLGRSRWVPGAALFGKLAHIGQPALDLNAVQPRPQFVPSFKRALSLSPLLTLARAGRRSYSAREVAYLYLRELLAEAHRSQGSRVRDLVITAPVAAFETYRAEVRQIAQRLGVRRVRFVDEPVAAALGYGLGVGRNRRVLVVDFGGGTLHLALVHLRAAEAQEGRTQVLAKAAQDVGGTLVDRWVMEELCRRFDWPVDEDEGREDLQLWSRLLLAEACRVKEAVYFAERTTFELSLPETRERFERRVAGQAASLEFSRAELVQVLEQRGLYRMLDLCLVDVQAQARAVGLSPGDIDDVLMVGGSTLLPKVYSFFEERFGRGKVRAWQPFEAVAYGAAVFAAGQVAPADFIVHDYALQTFDLKSNTPEYAVIVPQKTPFPTRPDFWKRQLVPTCGLGEPERVFKLVICEIGGAGGQGFVWDARGRLHRATDASAQSLVVKLNESNPVIGVLDPPQAPQDRTPRLEVSFGVNAERWLCATVVDLRTRRELMRDEPVVRLL
jgi:molecular chaperone DnaK (HSP70)